MLLITDCNECTFYKRIKVSNDVWYDDFVQNNIDILANYCFQKINKYDKYDFTTFPNHLPHVMQD